MKKFRVLKSGKTYRHGPLKEDSVYDESMVDNLCSQEYGNEAYCDEEENCIDCLVKYGIVEESKKEGS